MNDEIIDGVMQRGMVLKVLGGANAETRQAIAKHDLAQREALARVEAEAGRLAEAGLAAHVKATAAQAQLEEMRRIVAGFLFNYDDGVGKPWERRLLDYARNLVDAKEFNAQSEQQEAGEETLDDILNSPCAPCEEEAQVVQAGDDERQAALREMFQVTYAGDIWEILGRLYDAGYRRAALATQPAEQEVK